MVRRATFKVRQQAIIIHKKRALLLKYSNYTRKKTKWDFPGGHLIHGETVFESLQREVFEETGLTITEAEPLRTLAYDNGILIIYIAKAQGDDVKLSKEHTDYRWIAASHVTEVDIASPEIKDDILKALKYTI